MNSTKVPPSRIFYSFHFPIWSLLRLFICQVRLIQICILNERCFGNNDICFFLFRLFDTTPHDVQNFGNHNWHCWSLGFSFVISAPGPHRHTSFVHFHFKNIWLTSIYIENLCLLMIILQVSRTASARHVDTSARVGNGAMMFATTQSIIYVNNWVSNRQHFPDWKVWK